MACLTLSSFPLYSFRLLLSLSLSRLISSLHYSIALLLVCCLFSPSLFISLYVSLQSLLLVYLFPSLFFPSSSSPLSYFSIRFSLPFGIIFLVSVFSPLAVCPSPFHFSFYILLPLSLILSLFLSPFFVSISFDSFTYLAVFLLFHLPSSSYFPQP